MTPTLCPAEDCFAPLTVLDRFLLDSTDGPVEVAKVQCTSGHWFTLPEPPRARSDRTRPDALAERIRRSQIGDGTPLPGPYGIRRLTYADDTASARPLGFVEDYIRRNVLVTYANTHSENAASGRRTTALREHARGLIHRAVGATEAHAVLFCGSGATAAMDKVTRLLLPPGAPAKQTVVLVGPYEHHSNELQWRESGAEVIAIGSDDHGGIDIADLRGRLAACSGRTRVIGAFSAASNVTGIRSDVEAISSILHAHGALAVWDYTAAAPHVPITVAGTDAVAFSPHKFPGGPQTPGVLVIRRSLLDRPVPSPPGGGTIAFVDPDGALYTDDPVAREEGGTPAIVESVRAGAVIALRDAVGTSYIRDREAHWWNRACQRWSRHPNLEILGDLDAPRLPIVSFRVHVHGRVLHHHFIVAVLNDLFGIQARGGCSCAGPYGHRLLCITPRRSAALRAECARGYLGVKPGWTRITFGYYMSEAVGSFLLDAVDLTARYAHRLLPDYEFDPRSGMWWHRDRPADADVDVLATLLDPVPDRETIPETALDDYLRSAHSLLTQLPDRIDDGPTGLPEAFEDLREFHLPPVCVAGTHAESALSARPVPH